MLSPLLNIFILIIADILDVTVVNGSSIYEVEDTLKISWVAERFSNQSTLVVSLYDSTSSPVPLEFVIANANDEIAYFYLDRSIPTGSNYYISIKGNSNDNGYGFSFSHADSAPFNINGSKCLFFLVFLLFLL